MPKKCGICAKSVSIYNKYGELYSTESVLFPKYMFCEKCFNLLEVYLGIIGVNSEKIHMEYASSNRSTN